MTLRWKTPTKDISAFLGNCPPKLESEFQKGRFFCWDQQKWIPWTQRLILSDPISWWHNYQAAWSGEFRPESSRGASLNARCEHWCGNPAENWPERMKKKRIPSRWWFQIFFMFTPSWGKISNLTNIFQMGWNHQPAMCWNVNINWPDFSDFSEMQTKPCRKPRWSTYSNCSYEVFEQCKPHTWSFQIKIVFEARKKRRLTLASCPEYPYSSDLNSLLLLLMNVDEFWKHQQPSCCWCFVQRIFFQRNKSTFH